MPDTPEILRLRVLLCFLSEDETDCTVMEIARTLREEHYSISRATAALEKDGLISKEQPQICTCITDVLRSNCVSIGCTVTQVGLICLCI